MLPLHCWAELKDIEKVCACTDDAYKEFTWYYQNKGLYQEDSPSRVLVAVINGEIIVKPCFDKIAADLKQLTDMDDTKGVAEKIQLLLAVSDLKPDKITVTDQFGKGIFSQLKEGIYYIESVKYIEEEKEYMIMPLVLSLPQKQSGANNVYDIDAIPKIVERNVEQTSKTTNVITEETTTVENTTEDFTTKEQISKATDDNPKLPQTGLKTMNVVLIGCFGIALTLLGVRILKNEE